MIVPMSIIVRNVTMRSIIMPIIMTIGVWDVSVSVTVRIITMRVSMCIVGVWNINMALVYMRVIMRNDYRYVHMADELVCSSLLDPSYESSFYPSRS